jgi:hypothetical protein
MRGPTAGAWVKDGSLRLKLQATSVDVDQIGAIKVYFSFYATYLFSFLLGFFIHGFYFSYFFLTHGSLLQLEFS